MNVVDQFNKIKHQYKTSYFDIYTYLINKGWFPDELDYNSRDELWFEYLEESNNIQDDDPNRFYVEIYNCKTIIPSNTHVSSITDDNTLDSCIKAFRYASYSHTTKKLFNSNNFKRNRLEDTQIYYGVRDSIQDLIDEFNLIDELDTLTVYINPTFTLEVTKDNVYDLLEQYPLDVIHSNPWWDYK